MFTIVDATRHQKVPYMAQRFDHQQGYRFTFRVSDGHLVETGVYFHWKDGRIRDIAFDLSCMSGCVYRCRFCAATASNRRSILTSDDIVGQVRSAIQYVSAADASLLESCPLYTFSFEGMGEPSVPVASKAMVEAIRQLKTEFHQPPRRAAQFIVSTIGAHPQTIRTWADEDFEFETLQFSLHATTDQQRRALIGDGASSIAETIDALRYYKEKRPDTLIKVNYLLFQSGGTRNHSHDDLDRIVSLLQGTGFLLKLSHLNPTTPAKQNGIEGTWDEDTRVCYQYLREKYPLSYEYGTTENLGISCGQLASYAERSAITDSDSKEHIQDIYEQLVERNAVLFLGAGASRTAWNARGLAEELNNELPPERRLRDDALALDRVADMYLARNKLDKVHQKLRATIAQTPFPSEYVEMTRQPWRAIYTTNYDDFVEKAYSAGQQIGLTSQSYARVVRLSDLVQMAGAVNIVPVIKLHGCIQDPVGDQVITSVDYLEVYRDSNRQGLLKRLANDVREHCVVFAGYSLSDFHIAQLLYDLNHDDNLRLRVYSVAPSSGPLSADGQGERDSIMREKFNVTHIKCTFDEFLFELSRLRRQVRVFVSGSLKRVIPGSRISKEDVTPWGQMFLKELGARFAREDVIVRSGATATDKAGYHVASAMRDHDVKTYIWYGAERTEYNNEVYKMVNPHKYGFGPFDVVDRIIRECNVAVFVGGSALSLEEMFYAYSRRLLVIPIRLADESYASSIIHSFFSHNLASIQVVESERSAAATRRGRLRFSEFLTADRLARLDMNAHDPAEVVETVMEIIRHYQVAQL